MADSSDIPVIDQREAALRTGSGGYDAAGKPAGPAMVDMSTPAPPGPRMPPATSWVPGSTASVPDDQINNLPGMPPAPRPIPANTEAPMPSGLEFTVAALERNNFVSATYNRIMNHPDANAPDVEGYSAYDNNGIAGYEDHKGDFVDSGSPQQTQVIKERIDDARQADALIARVGAQGIPSVMAAGALDPISLTMMLIPGLGEAGIASRAGRIGAIVGTNVVAGEAQQAALTSMSGDNYTDNMLPRVATNALLAGVLGTLATRVPKAEFTELAGKADAAINGPAPVVPSESTGGAAAVRGTTLEDETFNSAGKAIAAIDAKLPSFLRSPSLRVMSSSPVVESRRLMQQIVDIGDGVLNKNMRNVPTSDNVEMTSNTIIHKREMQVIRDLDNAYTEHATEAGPNALSKHDFGAQVNVAMENGDKHEIPQVVKVAKSLRPFFDADHEELTRIAPDADYAVLQKTAQSYFPTVWDNNKITANRTEFEQKLYDHFKTHPKTEEVPEAEVKVQPKAIGEGNAQTFLDEFHEQNPEEAPVGHEGKRVGKANVALSQDEAGRVHVDKVQADTPGSALPALRRLIKLADKHGVTLQADASPIGTGGPSKADLIKLYEHGGFKLAPETPGGTATTMVRPGLNERLKAGPEEELKAAAAKRAKLDTEIKEEESVGQQQMAATAEKSGGPATNEKLNALKKARAEVPEDAAIKAEHEKQVLKEHEAAQPVETAKTAVGPPKPIFRDHAEILADVQDTIDNIQHAVRGTADIGTGVRNPKSTKARALDVDHNAFRDFLSDDFEGTFKAYNRSMVPHIEMHRQFGSVTLENEFQQIRDAYRVKMAAAGSNDVAKDKLNKAREKDIGDLAFARDHVLGQVGPRNNESLAAVRVAQTMRTVNYMRSLGGQLFSALNDWGRIVVHYGLGNTSDITAKFLSSSEVRNIGMADANRWGTATDIVLHTREHSLDGTGNIVPTGDKFSRFLQNQSARFTKLSMIAHWDASIRLLTAHLEQDSIYRAISGAKMSTLERERLAAHGIGDDDLAAIREQWDKHGTNEGGLNRARTELWDQTPEAQGAARKFENAVQRAASSNAFFVGKGDMPRWASEKQLGKFMFQFKGFVMASVSRLVLPLAQGIAHGDVKAANGLTMMLALGGLSYYLKERAAGRQPDMSPKNFAAEMVQRSGILAFAPDVYDPLAGLIHLPRFSKFKDHSWEETLGGPTLGEADILGQVVSKTTSGKMTAQDLHKVRQLLPYNTMFYLNRIFNLAEGKTADALNLKNALHRPALDYFNPAKDKEAMPPQGDNEHFLGINAIPNSQL